VKVRGLERSQRRVLLEDEERIARRERGDEGGVDREVVRHRVAAPAGPPVSVERLAEEDVGAGADRLRDQARHDAGIGGARGQSILRRERRGGAPHRFALRDPSAASAAGDASAASARGDARGNHRGDDDETP
jgi:hypothetical protein